MSFEEECKARKTQLHNKKNYFIKAPRSIWAYSPFLHNSFGFAICKYYLSRSRSYLNKH